MPPDPIAPPAAAAHRTAAAFDVAVVGAGVAGLATALGLSQLGLRVALIGPAPRVHRASPEVPFDSRIYALSAGSIDLLARLKVWGQVDASRLQAVARMRVFGDGGDELSFDAYGAQVERLATIGEESELLRVLGLGVQFAAGMTRLDTGLRALRVDHHAAELQLDDGQLLRAALVVGADGAQSAVRVAAGITANLQPYQQTAVVANFRAARPHDGVAWQWFCGAADGVVALLPLPGRGVSLVWSAPDALADELRSLEPDALAARVGARCQGVLGTFTPLGAAQSFPLRLLRVERLVSARVALVGDAAHVVHPLAGQGLNLGLQDVSTLLEVLQAREAWRDLGDPLLLRRYARRRAEPIGLIRFTTDGLARLFATDDPLLARLRNHGMGWVNRIAPLKTALIRHALG